MKISAVAALLFASLLAGCTSSTSGADPEPTEDGDDLAVTAVPVLYLNVTIGNETYRFTSADAAGGRGDGNATSTGTTTVSSGNSTAPSNATGNSTGNRTAGNATKATPGGDAPLNVSVSLEATRMPANQTLSWSIDFGDLGTKASAGNATGNSTASPGNSTAGPGNGTGKASGMANGTTLPAKAKHTYLEPGDYEIRSSLRQGNKTLGTLHVALLVGGNGTNSTATLAPGSPLGTVLFDDEGTMAAGLQVPFATACGQGNGGNDNFEWIIPATGPDNLTPAEVSHFLVVLDSSGQATLDVDLFLLDADGNEVGSGTSGSPDETIDVEGPFPAGTYTINVRGCVAVNASYTVHGEGTLVAA